MIQKDFLSQNKCNVSGCDVSSNCGLIYSVKHTRDPKKFNRWCRLLKMKQKPAAVNACQRHFPDGAPTKNNPDPNPSLFNPIPEGIVENVSSIGPGEIEEQQIVIESMDAPLPLPVQPPRGSVLKLAPNATIIDLKKIKENHDHQKPIRIEQMTVMIDEKDTVRVIDRGEPKKSHSSQMEDGQSALKSLVVRKRPIVSNWNASSWPPAEDPHVCTNFHSPKESNPDPDLGQVMDRMRRNSIDCNVAITDATYSDRIVYAHRSVLIGKSSYFYKYLYLKPKMNKSLSEFTKVTLPIQVEKEVIEAVVSHLYTGSTEELLNHDQTAVRELLTLFSLRDSLEMLDKEAVTEESSFERVKETSNEKENSVMVLTCNDLDDDVYSTPIVELKEMNDPISSTERKKKKRTGNDYSEDFGGRLKVSVQNIMENTLNPFLAKIEELFDSSSSTFQIAQTSQHIITLWHADILLTKLFDQNDLTKFFSDVVNGVLEKHSDLFKDSPSMNDSTPYTAVSISTQVGDPDIDESYSRSFIDFVGQFTLNDPLPKLSVGEMEILNYQHLQSIHIPKYVHMIALYRFNINLKKKQTKGDRNCKDTIMPSLLDSDILGDDAPNVNSDIDDLVKRFSQDDQLPEQALDVSHVNFQHVFLDLKRRIVSDLELNVTPLFHEELIMHIVVDQMTTKDVLPLTLGIFLGKGCNFCRKKECKSEDLTVPINPDNPFCPDRECIKKNLICDICNKQMSTSKSLARHKDTVHDVETDQASGSFICSHCGETFSKKWKLNIHEREHEDRKLELTCRYCKKTVRGSSALKKHISVVHETKPKHPCDFCSKLFKQKEALMVHRRLHTGEKPYRCIQCSYASRTKGNLKAHASRKHGNLSLFTTKKQQRKRALSHSMPEDGINPSNSEDQIMTGTIVAHPLSEGTFIIT